MPILIKNEINNVINNRDNKNINGKIRIFFSKKRFLDLDFNSKKEIFNEMNNHLLMDDNPSDYFNEFAEEPIFKEFPFTLLSDLKRVPQSPKYHPEGNVWNHTMLVIDYAAKMKEKSKDQKAFMWAALLHDIGKTDTTRNKKGKITAYNHDVVGAKLVKEFFKELTSDKAFVRTVTSLVKWHMQILYIAKSLRFADIEGLIGDIDFNEVALLGYCDRMGRLNPNQQLEKQNVNLFIKKCRDYMKQKAELH
jgi:tRNA nucleotidyltransferase (CCA-adding enzyme)